MPKTKRQPEVEETKAEIAVQPKKTPASSKPVKKTTALAPAAPLDLWRAFDDAFGRFRSDFEDLLFPSFWDRALPAAWRKGQVIQKEKPAGTTPIHPSIQR